MEKEPQEVKRGRPQRQAAREQLVATMLGGHTFRQASAHAPTMKFLDLLKAILVGRKVLDQMVGSVWRNDQVCLTHIKTPWGGAWYSP